MINKLRILALAVSASAVLSACSQSQSAVPVEPVYLLSQAAVSTDRFAGIVVSENAEEISREADKTIKELYVSEGEQVAEGQMLFSYDTEELQLTLDKQELELERLEAQIKSTQSQIAEVQQELKSATGDTVTQLNIQLRQLQTELTQATYDKSTQETEIDYTKKMLENVDVLSPIDGTIRKIDENNSTAYITIQQVGAYLVKGLLNEMNMSAGIMAGVQVKIISRLDENQTWNGTVVLVDYENAEQNSYDSMNYGSSSDMTSSSSYPFYIDLESTDGLLLGQHVFIQLAVEEPDPSKVWVPESYLMELGYDELTGNMTGYVWAVNGQDKLEKRAVTLGEYDMSTGSYEILSGLSQTDYAADPANTACAEGAAVSKRSEADFSATVQTEQTEPAAEQTGDSGLTQQEQESVAADIADAVENGE